jgi:hypothetical protein
VSLHRDAQLVPQWSYWRFAQATAATFCKIGDPSSLSRKVGGLLRLIVRLALLRAELERADSPSNKAEFAFTVVALVLVPHWGLPLSPTA